MTQVSTDSKGRALRRSNRSWVPVKLVAALTALALAVPAAAAAYPVVEPGSFSATGQPSGTLHGGGHNSTKAGLALSASQPVATTSTSGGDSFNWGDAAIGAGIALAVVALAGAGMGVTIRKRGTLATHSAPSPS